MTVAWFYNLLLALLILPFLFLSFFPLISILWLFRVKESTLVCEMVSFKFIAGLRKWLVLLSLLVLVQQYLTRERQFYKIEGKSLLGNVTAVMKVKDFFRCCFLCMQYGPVACLSFNLERNNNSIHTCELSSSEKYLEPQKMRRRLDYDYYSTEFQVWWPKPTHLGRLALRVGSFIIPIQWKICLFNGKLVCSDNAPCISSILLKEEDLLPHFLTLQGEEWIQFYDFSLLIQTSNDWEI